MSQESETTGQEAQPVAEVERIRDIIFGPQMRRYEQQFKRMAGQLDLLGKQLDELRGVLDQQQADQRQQANQLQEDMQQRYGELERSIADQIGKMEANVEQQTTQTRQLAVEMRKQGNDLRGEFTSALDALVDDKASRYDLGDLLMEMGTRLKGQLGLADLLGQLEEVAKSEPSE